MNYLVVTQDWECQCCRAKWKRTLGYYSIVADESYMDFGPKSCPACGSTGLTDSMDYRTMILDGVLAIAGEEPVDGKR
jgi:hypothetical protein